MRREEGFVYFQPQPGPLERPHAAVGADLVRRAHQLVAEGGGDPAAIAKEKGFEAMDTSALDALVDEAIANNQAAWDNYRGGNDKALGALIGAIMKASKGQADGAAVTKILQSRRTQ